MVFKLSASFADIDVSWLSKCIQRIAFKNWMQYCVGHVATTALPLSQNGLRSNLRASNL